MGIFQIDDEDLRYPMPMRLGFCKLFVIWVTGLLVGAAIIGFAIDAPLVLRLAGNYGHTWGTVVRTIPESHGQVIVRYSIGQVSYERQFGPYPWREGQSVPVYYYRPSPEIAGLSSPGDFLKEELPSWIAGSLLFSFFALACFCVYAGPQTRRLPINGVSPKLISALVAVSALVTLVSIIYLRPFTVVLLLGEVSRFTGVFLFIYLTWIRNIRWRQVIQSGLFWLANALILGGWFIERLD